MKAIRLCFPAAVMFWPAAGFAGAVEVAACRTIADDAQRLACFDRTVPGLAADIAASKPSSVSRFGQADPPPVREKDFGRGSNPALAPAVPPVTTMSDSVARLEIRDGKPVFYLGNGQVWAAQERRLVTLKGDGTDQAVIKRSLVGYLITINASAAQISVVRLK